jgi:CMP-N-acetylneuraminic acid synthetase
MTVTENKSDYWIQADSSSMNISRIFVDAPRRQQDRQPLWEENSAIYLTKVKSLYDTKSILGNKVLGIQVTPIQGLDINEPIDVKLAEFFINNL